MHRFGNLSRVASMLGILLTLLLAACGSSTTTNSPSVKTVALVTDIGGLNDQGFNQLAYEGYQRAMAKYGFPRAVIETVSESNYTSELQQAAKSSDMVIGVGFLMATALGNVAQEYPNKKFALVDSCADDAKGNCETLPNVAPLYFHEEQAGCLVGAIAGQMEVDGPSKSPKLLGHNTIGAVGGIEIPAVDHYIAGYKYCARKVDPSVNVIVNYSQSFTDTATCKDVATSQINQHHADIIFQVAGGCGVGALQAAQAKNVYGIGVDSDQNYINSNVITSAIKKVDVAVDDTIANFEVGKYTNNPPRFDLVNAGVGYAPVSSAVPADAKAMADKFASEIKAGTLVVPSTIPQ